MESVKKDKILWFLYKNICIHLPKIVFGLVFFILTFLTILLDLPLIISLLLIVIHYPTFIISLFLIFKEMKYNNTFFIFIPFMIFPIIPFIMILVQLTETNSLNINWKNKFAE
jgi:hypothetical protein